MEVGAHHHLQPRTALLSSPRVSSAVGPVLASMQSTTATPTATVSAAACRPRTPRIAATIGRDVNTHPGFRPSHLHLPEEFHWGARTQQQICALRSSRASSQPLR
jgi:hypothetical protein